MKIKLKKKKQTQQISKVNQNILNIIASAGIMTNDSFANIGDSYGKIFCISKYSDDNDYGWLAPLCNIKGTATCLIWHRTEPTNLIEVIDNTIGDNESLIPTKKKDSEIQALEDEVEDLKEMNHRIKVNDEPVGYLCALVFVQAHSEEALIRTIKKVNSVVLNNDCNLLNLRFKQKQALKVMSPYGIPSDEVFNMGAQLFPMETFLGGFPMAAAGINDEDGYYIGKTKNGRMIILDTWRRGGDRINSNWFISGPPGSGKSTFIKLLLLLEYAFGTKIIIFDPEEEYVFLTTHKDIRGNLIDGAGGAKGRINPLQIRKLPRIDEEDLEEGETIEDYFIYEKHEIGGYSDMALYLQQLKVFFKMYFSEWNADIEAYLEETLIELYNDNNISWHTDIDSIKNEDWPIIKELFVKVDIKSKDKSIDEYDKNIYKKLRSLLYAAGMGSDQFLWNGYTTIKTDKDWTDINVSRLHEVNERVKRAQYYLYTTWLWSEVAKNREEKVLAAIDEGYLFVDPEYPDLMKFLRNFSKRCRKYEGGLLFITHASSDVLEPEVKRLGQAIIDNACFKMIFGGDGKYMEETSALYKLSDREVEMLSARKRGKGLLMAGSIRLEIDIEVRDKYMEMFGAAGGR